MAEIIPEGETPVPVKLHTNIKHFILDLLETVGLAVVLFLMINAVSARVRVDGFSMLPTIDNGEFVLVNRLAYRFSHPERGDIIVFRPPMYPDASSWQRLFGMNGFAHDYKDYIKRIIGLPGETIRIDNGTVYINNIQLIETYIAAPPDYSGEWTVPEGQLFVLGDNRRDSADSHSWGFLPEENILGKALVVYWPFSDFMIIHQNQSVLAAP